MSTSIDTNSESWKRLSEDERFVAVQDVCVRFTKEFGNLPKVNYVWPTDSCITVCTALPHDTRLDDLPTSYEGVPVEQDAIREEMDAYIETWSMTLKHIAGWSVEQIDNLANDQHPCFTSACGLHDLPMAYIQYYLLSEKLQEGCSSDGSAGLEMERRIEQEINAGRTHKQFTGFPGSDPNYDWDAARERIISANSEMEQIYLKS